MRKIGAFLFGFAGPQKNMKSAERLQESKAKI